MHDGAEAPAYWSGPTTEPPWYLRAELEIDVMQDANDEQARMWNGPSGLAWVENQELLDRMFKPFEDLLVDVAAAKPRGSVLDVGCGAGATTLAVARGPGAAEAAPYVQGVDISEPLIAAAKARAAREGASADFICANAQAYPFEPARFDLIISRFGVMFFDDPVVAFANLRRAVRDDGELQVIAWRSAASNPFMATAERVAGPLLPDLPPRAKDGPGQFALADEGRVHAILEASGWAEIEIRPIDVACTLPEQDLVPYLTRLGPVGRALEDVDASTRAQVIGVVRAAFEPFVHGADVRFDAACWMIGARSGRS
jgi:SAM-dependent methyltransferase